MPYHWSNRLSMVISRMLRDKAFTGRLPYNAQLVDNLPKLPQVRSNNITNHTMLYVR